MFAERLLGALSLGRSFLLLEDGHDVDWEVGQDESAQEEHPHRTPLQSRLAPRRNGQGEPAVQPCLSPVGSGPAYLTVTALCMRRAGRAAGPRARCPLEDSRSTAHDQPLAVARTLT